MHHIVSHSIVLQCIAMRSVQYFAAHYSSTGHQHCIGVRLTHFIVLYRSAFQWTALWLLTVDHTAVGSPPAGWEVRLRAGDGGGAGSQLIHNLRFISQPPPLLETLVTGSTDPQSSGSGPFNILQYPLNNYLRFELNLPIQAFFKSGSTNQNPPGSSKLYIKTPLGIHKSRHIATGALFCNHYQCSGPFNWADR